MDVKYLWDFLEKGRHTLGLNVGVGYQADWYLNGKLGSSNLETIFADGIYPVIGLHYYYKHHQFELMYRFGGIFANSGYKRTNSFQYVDIDNSSRTIDQNTLYHQSYLTFNYAYRF
ncbi:hypothetical protein [Helicobacter sp. 13S00477-4]|uniref:hypothetical protein n=1 Tax=Helicobacter sp. 13S00477-4 TaxID=1905759 RepID=UPI000BA5BA1C|nr:hypothetical protein [Helicobacter sp. 13S00477-4]PAF51273.1 hypothetical protein BKH44_06085 [Helicobacter sp. 13S00477-4]